MLYLTLESLDELWDNFLACYYSCYVRVITMDSFHSGAGKRNTTVKFKMEYLHNSVNTIRYYDYELNLIFMDLFYYY
jgi:hypothetical protein